MDGTLTEEFEEPLDNEQLIDPFGVGILDGGLTSPSVLRLFFPGGIGRELSAPVESALGRVSETVASRSDGCHLSDLSPGAFGFFCRTLFDLGDSWAAFGEI